MYNSGFRESITPPRGQGRAGRRPKLCNNPRTRPARRDTDHRRLESLELKDV